MPQLLMPQRSLLHSFSRRLVLRRALSAFLAGATLVGLNALQPAHAQLEVQTVAVLDFEVVPGLDPNLGRKAADALAVELQTSTANEPVARQRIEVVPRQRMLQTINDTTALTPPYTDIIQMRLARATGASSVFSGRVLSATVTPGKAARVAVEVIQFEASMGDYSNGAISSQSAVNSLGTIDSDLLIDEALNKAVYAALLEIKRKPFPVGTVQIVTRQDALINLGSRNGVSRGQTYAILRDVYRGRDATDRDIVERIKIGEMLIVKVDVDQAAGVLTSGGGAGVKISDKVRKIYVPSDIKQELKDQDLVREGHLTPDQIKARDAAEAARRTLEEHNRRQEEAERAAQQRAIRNRGRNNGITY